MNEDEFKGLTLNFQDTYRCPKCGYKSADKGFSFYLEKDGDGKSLEVNICPCCVLRYLKSHFPEMKEIKEGK